MISTYELSMALPNKWLNPDGSITDNKGNVVSPASESMMRVYNNSKAIVNKFVDADGNVRTYAEISLELFVPVDVLPDVGESNKIYLVPNSDGTFDEYYWNNGYGWEVLGSVNINLSNYPTFDQMTIAITEAINDAIYNALGGEY